MSNELYVPNLKYADTRPSVRYDQGVASAAWEAAHLFPASTHKRLRDFLVRNKGTDAYVFLFDSYTAAVPGTATAVNGRAASATFGNLVLTAATAGVAGNDISISITDEPDLAIAWDETALNLEVKCALASAVMSDIVSAINTSDASSFVVASLKDGSAGSDLIATDAVTDDALTGGSDDLILNSAKATWLDGTPCRFTTTDTLWDGIEAGVTYYLHRDADTDFRLYPTLRDALLETNQIDLVNDGAGTHTIHVLDWPAPLAVDAPQGPTKGLSLSNYVFRDGIYALASLTPDSYSAAGADFLFNATYE